MDGTYPKRERQNFRWPILWALFANIGAEHMCDAPVKEVYPKTTVASSDTRHLASGRGGEHRRQRCAHRDPLPLVGPVQPVVARKPCRGRGRPRGLVAHANRGGAITAGCRPAAGRQVPDAAGTCSVPTPSEGCRVGALALALGCVLLCVCSRRKRGKEKCSWKAHCYKLRRSFSLRHDARPGLFVEPSDVFLRKGARMKLEIIPGIHPHSFLG